jgi:hypothetical protein
MLENPTVISRGRVAQIREHLLAKQVLSQLSYTPTREATLILKHFPPFRNRVLRIFVITVPKLYQNPRLRGPAAPRQRTFHWPSG